MANGQPVAQIEVAGEAEQITYLYPDHLMTTRLGMDETGTVVWHWEGEAFGESEAEQDPDGDGQVTVMRLRFPGQYYDQEINLHYNYFRYYDPCTGRYITSDPIGLAGGLNTYVYVGGNPVNLTDPFELAPPKPLPPERNNPRNCNTQELAACQQICGSKGVQSCKISRTWRIKRFKNGLSLWGWYDASMSCSCNDPEGFCGRNPKTCAAGIAIGICILLAMPIPDDVLILGLIGARAATP